MRLGLLGPEGTFSDVARIKYENKVNQKFEVTYYPSISHIFNDYENLDLLIVPIENTLDGHITQCLDGILQTNLKIIDEVMVDVSFSFLSNAKSLEEVSKLHVQFKAQQQCLNFINKLNCKINVTESNIESLNLLEGNDGAIVPSHCYSSDYNINIKNVTDSLNNQTNFFVLSKESLSNGSKCTICMKTIYDNRKGLLCDILKVLDKYDYNLAFILSRPTKKVFGQYNFFAEIDNITDISKLKKAFKEIEDNKLAKVEILGIY